MDIKEARRQMLSTGYYSRFLSSSLFMVYYYNSVSLLASSIRLLTLLSSSSIFVRCVAFTRINTVLSSCSLRFYRSNLLEINFSLLLLLEVACSLSD